jgi:hypothetical protein
MRDMIWQIRIHLSACHFYSEHKGTPVILDGLYTVYCVLPSAPTTIQDFASSRSSDNTIVTLCNNSTCCNDICYIFATCAHA